METAIQPVPELCIGLIGFNYQRHEVPIARDELPTAINVVLSAIDIT